MCHSTGKKWLSSFTTLTANVGQKQIAGFLIPHLKSHRQIGQIFQSDLCGRVTILDGTVLGNTRLIARLLIYFARPKKSTTNTYDNSLNSYILELKTIQSWLQCLHKHSFLIYQNRFSFLRLPLPILPIYHVAMSYVSTFFGNFPTLTVVWPRHWRRCVARMPAGRSPRARPCSPRNPLWVCTPCSGRS